MFQALSFHECFLVLLHIFFKGFVEADYLTLISHAKYDRDTLNRGDQTIKKDAVSTARLLLL